MFKVVALINYLFS